MAMLLCNLGARVSGLSLAPDAASLFEQARVASRLGSHHVVDLQDLQSVEAVVSAEQPEVVIHFAAQSLVREAYQKPSETFATNVMGTVNLFEALRHCRPLRAILTATTDKVYFNSETGRHFVETDPLGGLEPYSASKAATEWVVAAYRRSYHAPADIVSLTARAGNIIGGGDWAKDRLIPDAIRAAQTRTPLVVRSPGAVRPWQFVLDALEGYLMLVQHGLQNAPDPGDPSDGAYNFGPMADQPGATVAEVCCWIADAWPGGLLWSATGEGDAIKESKLLYLDSHKANRRLGWQPRHSPRAAVNATLDWYIGLQSGRDPFELCLQQIEDRLADARAKV
jgi:CDP-glucose 4,6-dehydratase